MGHVVVDDERLTRSFPAASGVREALAIYQVENGKMAKARLIFGPKTLDAKP